MRRAARVIAGISIVVASAAVILPLTIDLDKVQRRSAERLGRVLGRPVAFTQPLRVHLLPIPILTTGPILIGDPGAPVAQVAGITAHLSIAPLLAGLIEPAELTLERPSLHLPGAHLHLDSLSLTRASFSPLITGEARWNGHVATLSGSVSGDDGTGLATLSLRLPSAGASVDFSGTITPLAMARSLRGHITAIAADLSPLGGPAHLPLKLETDLEAGGGEVALPNLVAELGLARATASLSAAHGDPAVIDVAAKVTGLDLDSWRLPPEVPIPAPVAALAGTPAAGGPPPAGAPGSSPPSFPAPVLSLPTGIFANLNLSIDDLTWQGQKLRQVRVEATLEQGALLIREAKVIRPDGGTLTVDGTLTAPDGLPGFDGRAKLAAKGGAGTARVGVAWPDLTFEDIRVQAGERWGRGRLAVRLGLPLAVQVSGDISRIGPLAASGLVGLTADGVDITSLRLSWRGLDVAGRAKAGFAGPRPRIEADLSADTIDLDRLSGPRRSGHLLPGNPRMPPVGGPVSPVEPVAARPKEPAGDTPWSREPIDLSGLFAADLKLDLHARSLTGQGLRLDNADGRLGVENGTAILEKLNGMLWGGRFEASGRLVDGAAPSLSGRMTLNGADAGAVGLGVGEFKVTQGRMDADARFSTSGRSTWDMAGRLAGDGKVMVKDGSISGFDLPAVQRRMNDIQTLGNIAALLQTGLAGGSTRFASLAGTVQAKDGIAVTRDLKLDAQGGSAAVESTVDLPRWSTNTALALRIGESSAPPLVVRLDGPIGNPRKVLDANAIQRYLVEKGLGRALNKAKDDNGGGEKPSGKRIMQDLFRGLLGR
jgi:hypothetical protein